MGGDKASDPGLFDFSVSIPSSAPGSQGPCRTLEDVSEEGRTVPFTIRSGRAMLVTEDRKDFPVCF